MAPLSLEARGQSPTHLANVDPENTQLGYNSASLFCLIIATYLATIRIRQYRKARIVYPARVLTSATYCTVIVYLFILNMLATGAGLHDYELCKVAIYICLVFYGTVKGLLLYFMAERVRTVRSMDIARKHDKLWISCVVIITLGLSGVVATALAKANYSFKEEMGMCRVGIPDGATVAVLMFDLVMNAWLTGSFLWLLRPILREHAELQGADQLSTFSRKLFKIRIHRSSSVVDHHNSQLGSNHFDSAAEALPGEDTTSGSVHEEPKEHKEHNEHKEHKEQLPVITESPLSETTTQRADSDALSVFVLKLPPTPEPNQHINDPEIDIDIHKFLQEEQPISPTEPQIDGGRPSTLTTEQVSTIVRLDKLVKKSLVGTILLFAPCVANGVLYWYFKGFEPAWLCLTACSLDVTLAVGVLHWLTENGEDDA